jgi:hypothetical protein
MPEERTKETSFEMELYAAASRILAANVAHLGIDAGTTAVAIAKATGAATKLFDKLNEEVGRE